MIICTDLLTSASRVVRATNQFIVSLYMMHMYFLVFLRQWVLKNGFQKSDVRDVSNGYRR